MNDIYSIYNIETLSIEEMEAKEKKAHEYFCTVGERYPKSSGHPFTSDPEHLKKVQEEREQLMKLSMEIRSAIYKRKEQLSILELEAEHSDLIDEINSIETRIHKMYPTFKAFWNFQREYKKLRKLKERLLYLETVINRLKKVKP